MKLLQEYTLDYIRRNRRSSLAVMVAVLMTATMLSALCGLLYTIYTDSVRYTLQVGGDWHSELNDYTYGRQLPLVEANDRVENIMVKGDWRAAQIDDPRRDYLVWRDANADYWEYMAEKNSITEGRVPMKSGEIALSKQYFEHHPELKIGDTLTLPMGERMAGGEVIEPRRPIQPGERFVSDAVVALTVVGKLDLTTSSTTPAYTALGFLERDDILPDDTITVYMRFHSVRDTYTETPKIAEAAGYQKDEYGSYRLRYNTDYLLRVFVLSPDQVSMLDRISIAGMPATCLAIGLFAAAVFVLIVHNAFALSASSRLTQLGILASIGATPKQIKRSVLFEAFVLSAIPLPLGILLGAAADYGLLAFINSGSATITGERDPILFSFGLPAVLPAVLLTLLTVWWSALIPARKVAKLSPIEAIRQGDRAAKLQKPRRRSLETLFGLPGELASASIHARRRSYRTATISLLLSFLLFAAPLFILTTADASKAVYGEDPYAAQQDIAVRLSNCTQEDLRLMRDKVDALEGISSARWYNQLIGTVWLAPVELSWEFAAAGAYEPAPLMNIPLFRDGKYRQSVVLVGMDDASFAEYCAALGIDPAPFYDPGQLRGIFCNTIKDAGATKRNPVKIPYLDKKAGDVLTCYEAREDADQTDFSYRLEIAHVTTQLPQLAREYFGGSYGVMQFLPISQTYALSEQLLLERGRAWANNVTGVIKADSCGRITPLRTQIDAFCESYFGSGDYNNYDDVEAEKSQALGTMFIGIMMGFVVGLFAVIGLSNVWATISGNLHNRAREFSMLRSVGLSPKGLRQMLNIEGLLLGLTPLLLAIPLLGLVLAGFLVINEVTFLEWLPFVPLLPILLYTAGVLGVVVLAYFLGGRRLAGQNIMETIKADTV